MTITVHEVKNFKVIRLDGKLIAGEPANALRARVHEELAGDKKQLAIDLTRVGFLDSTGIGAIAGISFAAREAGGICRFFAASPAVLDILTKVNLHRAIQLFPDESAALKK
jgi:anti-sigma B factor antagonist